MGIMPTTVTLSSVGTSGAINLDYLAGQTVSAWMTFSSTSISAAYTVQLTGDDLTLVASPHWINDSAATALTSAAYVSYAFPVAAIRFTSSALSAGSISMKALQGYIR